MSILNLADFNKPQLSKTEKAIVVLEQSIKDLMQVNYGLQRQIAGLCIEKGISPQKFAANNHNDIEIDNFLSETDKAEQLIINAKIEEGKEKAKSLELLQNGDSKTEKTGKSDS